MAVFAALMAAFAFAVFALVTDNAALLLSALVVGLGSWAILRDYRVLVLVYSIIPTIAFGVGGTFITPFILLTPVAIGATIYHYRSRWKDFAAPKLFVFPVVALLLWSVTAEINTTATMVINPIVNLTGALAVGLIINAFLKTKDDLRDLSMAIVFNVLILSVSALSQIEWSSLNVMQVRVSGLAGEPNVLGMHLGRMMPVVAAVIFEKAFKPWQRGLSAGTLAISTLALFGSASRTGTIAVVVGMGVVTWFGARSLRAKVLGFGLFAAIMVTSTYLAPASFQTRVLQPFGLAHGETFDINQTDVTSGRIGQLPIGLSMIEANPILGNGTGGYAAENANRYMGTATVLHNAFLSVPVAYGVPAGILFVFAIAASLVVGFMSVRRSPYPVLTAAIASGALATAVALSAYPESFRAWIWLPFVLPHAFARVARNAHAAAQKSQPGTERAPPARAPTRPLQLPAASPRV